MEIEGEKKGDKRVAKGHDEKAEDAHAKDAPFEQREIHEWAFSPQLVNNKS